MKHLTPLVARGYLLFTLLIFSFLLASCSGNGNATETAGVAGDVPADEEKTVKPHKKPFLAAYESNFIGEWKSVESEKRDHMVISQNGKNFIVKEGNDVTPGIYDKENKVIRINVGAPLDIMYVDAEDMLVVSGGGKYRRISKK